MRNLLVLFLSLVVIGLSAQNVVIDGYAYESGNRGFLNTVFVKIYDDNGALLAEGFSDVTGHFVIEVPAKSKYKLLGTKDMFHEKEMGIDRTEADAKVFVKMEMRRAPGYNFEITLANKRDDENVVVDAIKGADIEVYNNTTGKMVLNLESHNDPKFEVPLLKENHYTLFVRKEGYLSKRMEAFVNVKDCILCFEGVGEIRPGVSDNLTEGNETGVLLANVELEKIYAGKELRINNIYYETGSAEILSQAATELDNLITILEDNPHLKVELGSHTDSRGKSEANMLLSQKRAQKAVEYIVNNGNVKRDAISWKGYGESKLLNKCTSFVDCSDAEHAKNRRTEITVLGVDPNIKPISLAERINQQKEADLINELLNQTQVRVSGDEKPDFLDTQESKAKEEAKSIIEEEAKMIQETGEEFNEDVDEMEKKSAISLEKVPVIKWKQDEEYYTIIYYFSRVELEAAHNVNQVENHMVNKDSAGNFIYHVGLFESEIEAIQLLNDEIRNDYNSAYISKFKNGKFSSY